MDTLLIILGSLALLIVGSALLARLTRPHWPPVTSLIVEPQVDARAYREDGTLHLAWAVPAEMVTIHALPAANADPAEVVRGSAPLAKVHAAQSATLDVPAAPRPIFALHFQGGPLDGRVLPVAERHLAVEGAANVRDLGGYRTTDGRTVRWGQVLRAGDLSGLTPAGYATLRGLGIRLVCDLRSAPEVADAAYRLPEDFPAAYVHAPIYDTTGGLISGRDLLLQRRRLDTRLIEGYTQALIDQGAPYFGAILRRLADPAQRPALIHCTAGKDRTGLAAALLLAALDVPEDVIVADYTLSNYAYPAIYRTVDRAVRGPVRLWLRTTDLQPLLTANPATLRATFAHLRARYGSPADYLRDAAGLEDAVLDALRGGLLEETKQI